MLYKWLLGNTSRSTPVKVNIYARKLRHSTYFEVSRKMGALTCSLDGLSMCSHQGSDLWWLSWAWLRHGAVIMMWMRGGLIVCTVWEFKVERTGTVFIVSFLICDDSLSSSSLL
ncbi:hypothetical protein PTI98_007238 [Pleurotus ostreatus]|nr:hypothetical protein PTI98_007238 [Pleurotus ostreatus]